MGNDLIRKSFPGTAELPDTEEGVFLHSPTYLQMKERIHFLENISELSKQNTAAWKKRCDDQARALAECNAEIKRLRDEISKLKSKEQEKEK